MNRQRLTVVAVAHGSEHDEAVPVEVYVCDSTQMRGAQLSDLVRYHQPMPGEMDSPGAIDSRMGRMGSGPGFAGLQTVPGESLSRASAASGSLTQRILDADYSAELGQVLCFDAEVDMDTGEVDWGSARPNRFTEPASVSAPPEGIWERFDGVLVNPDLLADGGHRAVLDVDGAWEVRNEFGVPLVGLDETAFEDSAAVASLGLPRTDVLAVVSQRPDGSLWVQAMDLESVAAGGSLDLADGTGQQLHPMELEALVWASGESSERFQDADMGRLRVVQASVFCETDEAGRVQAMDPLGAEPMERAPVQVAEPRYDRRGALLLGAARQQQQTETARPGSIAEVLARRRAAAGAPDPGSGRPAPRGPEPVAARQRPSVAPEPAFAAARERPAASNGPGEPGIDDLLGGTAALAELTRSMPRSSAGARAAGRKSLAAVRLKSRGLLDKHGPAAMSLVTDKLNDPQVRAKLRTAAVEAFTAAAATPGGGKVKAVAAAGAASRHVVPQGLRAAMPEQRPTGAAQQGGPSF